MDAESRAKSGTSDATRITVGTRGAVEVSITTNAMNGKMVFIPEGTTWLLCVVGTVGGGAPDNDTAWIIQHLTSK